MFRINFYVPNPFKAKERKQDDIILIEKQVTENRAFELQLSSWTPNTLCQIKLDLIWFGEDHAGPRFEIEVYGNYFCIALYRVHHWNYKEHRWYRNDGDPFGEDE